MCQTGFDFWPMAFWLLHSELYLAQETGARVVSLVKELEKLSYLENSRRTFQKSWDSFECNSVFICCHFYFVLCFFFCSCNVMEETDGKKNWGHLSAFFVMFRKKNLVPVWYLPSTYSQKTLCSISWLDLSLFYSFIFYFEKLWTKHNRMVPLTMRGVERCEKQWYNLFRNVQWRK